MGCVGSTDDRIDNIQIGAETTKKRKHKLSQKEGKTNLPETTTEKKNSEPGSPHPNLP